MYYEKIIYNNWKYAFVTVVFSGYDRFEVRR